MNKNNLKLKLRLFRYVGRVKLSRHKYINLFTYGSQQFGRKRIFKRAQDAVDHGKAIEKRYRKLLKCAIEGSEQ